jgi:hypothetical protein
MKTASLVLSLCALLAGCAVAPDLPDEHIDDGLQLAKSSLLDELYVAPEVSLAKYRRVMLDPIEIEFKQGWREDHKDLADKDFEALRARMTKMLREKLVAEFERGGYAIAEAPEADVLRVRASIVDAQFAAPESNLDKHTYTRSNGRMILRVQAFDAPSGAIVARARDYEEDPETQRFERNDRVTTDIAAKRIFEKWAVALRSALDVANVSVGARKPQQ